MEVTNNSIPNLLSFSLLPLSHLTQITMGCFLNTADSLNQSLIGFSTASSPNTSYAASPARFGGHNNTSHVTANYMKFRTYLELVPTTKWKGDVGCLVEFLSGNRIRKYCDIIQNYGLWGCDLVQYWTPTFRRQLLSAVSGLKTLRVDIAVTSDSLVSIFHVTRRQISYNRNVSTHCLADIMKFTKTSQTPAFHT